MPLLVGMVLAVLSAYLLSIPGWFDRAEGLSLDFLFRYGRLSAPRSSDRIVHVDIDDSSLQTFGRWPWKRSLIADAVDEIDSFGPRVIALDLLFDEPDADRPGEDARLAASLKNAHARTVIAIQFPSQNEQLGPLWRGADGQAAFDGILNSLEKDNSLSADAVVQDNHLNAARAQRVRDRMQTFRELAIEKVARNLQTTGALDLKSLEARMLPHGGFAPSEIAMRKIADRLSGIRLVSQRLPLLGTAPALLTADRISLPVLQFVQASSAVGFVTTETDRDGAIRRVAPFIGFDGRIFPQIGVCAAMLAQGIDPRSVKVEKDSVQVGQTAIPLHDGKAIVTWPRLSDASGPARLLHDLTSAEPSNPALAVLRQAPEDSPVHGHIAIGVILDLQRKLQTLHEKEQAFGDLSRSLTAAFLSSSGISPDDWDKPQGRQAIQAGLLDQARFLLTQDPDDPKSPVSEPGPSAGNEALACWRWYQYYTQLPGETRALTDVQDRLKAQIQGKIVFVGWITTGSLSDVYPTSAGPLTPGVVVNAMMANMVLTGYTFSAGNPQTGMILTAFLGAIVAGVAGIRGIRPLVGLALAIVLAGGYVAVNSFVLFESYRIFVPLLTPLVGTGLGLFGATFTRGLYERRDRARLTRQFGNRIHKRLFEYLLEHPDVLDMQGMQREVTCMFGDLAGFTSISESLDSRTTVAVLNRYMRGINALLTAHEAYVNKFLGDGMMAFWGAFEVDESHAEKACRAALACMTRIDELNVESTREGMPRLSMRIGLATGTVTVGDCGAPPEFSDFTIIGDSVNLASRLESANKQFGTALLANGRLNELLSSQIVRRPLGLVTVVGQSKPVEVFEIMQAVDSPDDIDDEIDSLIQITSRAVRLFRERNLDEAEQAWRELVRVHGESKLSSLYLAEIARFRAQPDELFDGVIRLASK